VYFAFQLASREKIYLKSREKLRRIICNLEKFAIGKRIIFLVVLFAEQIGTRQLPLWLMIG